MKTIRSTLRVLGLVAAIIATVVPLVGLAPPAVADVNGATDPNVGTGGMVTTAFAMDQPNARAVAVRPDGKIVLAGRAIAAQPIDVVAQYLPSGAPDLSFGGGDGFVVPNVTLDVESMALQADGKILIGGSNGSGFAVQRLNADGTSDSLNIVKNLPLQQCPGFNDYPVFVKAYSLLAQNDGTFVVGIAGTGTSPRTSACTKSEGMVMRFMNNGAEDAG